MIDPQFDVELKALATKFQVHIKGTATPVNPDEDVFDITADAVPAPADQPTPSN